MTRGITHLLLILLSPILLSFFPSTKPDPQIDMDLMSEIIRSNIKNQIQVTEEFRRIYDTRTTLCLRHSESPRSPRRM